jgi:hypothetical protein
MAETRRERSQKPEAFTRETVIEIDGVRSTGAQSAEDIATALNRSGYTNWRGHQWDADQIMSFLANPEIEHLRRELKLKR